MKMGFRSIAAAALLLLATGAVAEEVAGLPVHIQRLAPEAIRIWIGDTISSTATVAIATDGGLVIIDTTGFPRVDGELRRIIAREFGRSDFKILINTHEHGDHTGGNCVYSDCEIVGHELVEAGMAAQAGDRQRMIDWNTTRIGELRAQIAALPADSAATKRSLREQLTLTELTLETGKSDAATCPPTRTFADRLTLNVGRTAFELYYIGGMHSASDIAVFVPTLGLLMTGDTMADTWLTDTPGCLASFTARPGVRHDFPLLLVNWGRLLAKQNAIELLVPGHWNGELSYAGAEARIDYVRTLWTGINEAAAQGRQIDDLYREYTLAAKFPQLVGARGFQQRFNIWTIQEMWTAVTGQQSAADRLYALIDEGADERAIREVIAGRGVEHAKYYYSEAAMNGSGYAFLQQSKVPQAVALFKLVVELYPESWNAYDSLGEALLGAGDSEGALRMYEKSVELNPDNQNGKDALARIRSGAAKT